MHVSVPAQHGVGLCSEDGRVHYEARVVHDEGDALAGAQAAHAPSAGLLGALVVDVGQVGGAAVALYAGGVGTQQATAAAGGGPEGTGAGREGGRRRLTLCWAAQGSAGQEEEFQSQSELYTAMCIFHYTVSFHTIYCVYCILYILYIVGPYIDTLTHNTNKKSK